MNAYLSSRLSSISLDAGNGTAKLFCKSGQPASIPFDQFLHCLFDSHGQAGSGIRRPAGVSVKYPCTNQCSRPSVDLKDTFPLIGVKEIQVSRVAYLLAVISQSQNPSVSFNPAVFKKSFGIGNLLTYLWFDLALLVGSKQEMWSKYHSLVPLKIWNCNEPIIYGKLQTLSMKTGSKKENAKLIPGSVLGEGLRGSPPPLKVCE